jgi:predicted transcriptional regulator
MRGSKSDLIIEQGPQTGNKPELFVKPHGDIDKIEALLKEQDIEIARSGERLKIVIPDELRTTHEEHFAAVRNDFIACVDGRKKFPSNMKNALEAKYSLLAAARDLAAEK